MKNYLYLLLIVSSVSITIFSMNEHEKRKALTKKMLTFFQASINTTQTEKEKEDQLKKKLIEEQKKALNNLWFDYPCGESVPFPRED